MRWNKGDAEADEKSTLEVLSWYVPSTGIYCALYAGSLKSSTLGCRTPTERTYGCNHMTVSSPVAAVNGKLTLPPLTNSAEHQGATRMLVDILSGN